MSADDIKAAFESYGFLSRQSWEQTRLISFSSVSPHLDGKTTIEKYMPFAWDKKTAKNIEIMSAEVYEKLKKRYKLK